MVNALIKFANILSFIANFIALRYTTGIRWPHFVCMVANILAILAIDMIEFAKMRRETKKAL